MVLRNVVPRQGTEITGYHSTAVLPPIEKCSSPTGDGNKFSSISRNASHIEKCSSPTGDGNTLLQFIIENGKKLRNVVPRQGTEIINNVEYRPDGHALRNVVPRQGTEIQKR